jgi:hypothetical protein
MFPNNRNLRFRKVSFCVISLFSSYLRFQNSPKIPQFFRRWRSLQLALRGKMLPVYSAGQALFQEKIIFHKFLIIKCLRLKMLQKGYKNVTLCNMPVLRNLTTKATARVGQAARAQRVFCSMEMLHFSRKKYFSLSF